MLEQLQQLKTDIDSERQERIDWNVQNLKQVRQEVESYLKLFRPRFFIQARKTRQDSFLKKNYEKT